MSQIKRLRELVVKEGFYNEFPRACRRHDHSGGAANGEPHVLPA